MRSALLICGLLVLPATAMGEEKTTKATVLVKGVHCDACVTAIRKSLASVKGTKVGLQAISRGERPRFFSEPFAVEVGSTLDTGIGALAKATAAADTPHKDDLPPRLNLILYTDQNVDEETVMALRAALADVNGVLVQESGGLGGFPRRGFFWVRLEPAGGADLQQVFKAASKAVKVSLVKN